MTKETNYTLRDIYEIYVERGGELSYQEFRTVCEAFNKKAMHHITHNGRALDMGHGLSSLSVVRFDRNYENPVVDWGASLALRDKIKAAGETPRGKETPDGEDWLVYRTDPQYFKFHWRKSRVRIPNKRVYKFHPTRGKKGVKGQLHQVLLDSNNHQRFDHIKHI